MSYKPHSEWSLDVCETCEHGYQEGLCNHPDIGWPRRIQDRAFFEFCPFMKGEDMKTVNVIERGETVRMYLDEAQTKYIELISCKNTDTCRIKCNEGDLTVHPICSNVINVTVDK